MRRQPERGHFRTGGESLTGEKAEENVALTGGEYLAAASPVRSDGAVSGVVLLLFDVTQKQKAEAFAGNSPPTFPMS